MIINKSYCQFERSREHLQHLDSARCDKKQIDCCIFINVFFFFLIMKTKKAIKY